MRFVTPILLKICIADTDSESVFCENRIIFIPKKAFSEKKLKKIHR